jgi:hypothetical protein
VRVTHSTVAVASVELGGARTGMFVEKLPFRAFLGAWPNAVLRVRIKTRLGLGNQTG